MLTNPYEPPKEPGQNSSLAFKRLSLQVLVCGVSVIALDRWRVWAWPPPAPSTLTFAEVLFIYLYNLPGLVPFLILDAWGQLPDEISDPNDEARAAIFQFLSAVGWTVVAVVVALVALVRLTSRTERVT